MVKVNSYFIKVKCPISYIIVCIGESVIRQLLVPICLKYCLNCTTFGKLIHRNVIKLLPPDVIFYS